MGENEATRLSQPDTHAIERSMRGILVSAKTPEDCERVTREWLVYLEPAFAQLGIETAAIRDALNGALEDPATFVDTAMRALLPVLEQLEKDPALAERVRRRAFVEKGGFTPVDEEDFFSYGVGGDKWVHIHIAPGETLPVEKKRDFFVGGLKAVARLAISDETLEGIRATSPLVARAPRVMQKFGFAIDGSMSDEDRQKWLPTVPLEEPIDIAHMDRKDLIARYGI